MEKIAVPTNKTTDKNNVCWYIIFKKCLRLDKLDKCGKRDQQVKEAEKRQQDGTTQSMTLLDLSMIE